MHHHSAGPTNSELSVIELGSGRGSGREYKAYPNFKNARWLLPTEEPVLRRAGIRGLFQPGSLRGQALRSSIEMGILPGEKVCLEEDALSRLETILGGLLNETEVRLAFYLGIPAPHRNITVQVLTPLGETLAYAKVATSTLSEAALANERHALKRLAGCDALRGKIPEVLDCFGWQGGKAHVLTKGPARLGSNRLTSAHSDFCEDLFHCTKQEQSFGESPMWSRMSETWIRVKQGLPETLPAHLGVALERLHDELGPVLLPLSVAHGDFAPWNTRQRPQSLFVFDWERSAVGTTPLYDVFNFSAFQAALHKRRSGLPDARFLRTLLGKLWPEGLEHLPLLHLAYLVDVGLIYGEAQIQAPGVGELDVWRWFMDQIEAFLSEPTSL